MALLQLLERLEAEKLQQLEACIASNFGGLASLIAAAETAILRVGSSAGVEVGSERSPRTAPHSPAQLADPIAARPAVQEAATCQSRPAGAADGRACRRR
jgi:hypothetical protein